MESFSEKVVIVSGAAGALGREVVKAYLREGATVCALEHREGRLGQINFGGDHNGRLEAFENVDLSQADSIPSWTSSVHERVGPVDIIVHTVGGFSYGEKVSELSAATLQKMLDVNVNAFLNLAAAFVPDLAEGWRKDGCLQRFQSGFIEIDGKYGG